MVTENSLVGVGDETGFVRLIETEKDLAPGFNATYLGIACHDNAVFDISWSPDDHKLVRIRFQQDLRESLLLTMHVNSTGYCFR